MALLVQTPQTAGDATCPPQLTREERRELVDQACLHFQVVLGLQRDSARNQAEHVEALWESCLARQPGCGETALRELASELLRTPYEWVRRVWVPLAGEVEREEDALDDVCLYLLLWGELGNLRFCPELLCFLFAAARSFCREVAAADVGWADPPAEGAFLKDIVKPIFAVVLSETFQPGDPPQVKFGRAPAPARACNYDDWNELFWDPSRVRRALRMRKGASPTRASSGLVAMPSFRWRSDRLIAPDTRAADVWRRLPDVDWAASLQGHKSHLELHSLLPLLIGHYRIFLCQSLGFAIMLLCFANQPRWGTWVERAAVGLVAPAWMLLYEVGHQALTPALALSSRVIGIVTLVCFYLLPFASFVVVVVAEQRQLNIPAFSLPLVKVSIDGHWKVPALTLHFVLSGLVLLLALAPQRQNPYRWSFYPKRLRSRTLATAAFWFVVLAVAGTLNALAMNLSGEALHGVWVRHTYQEPWEQKLLLAAQSMLLIVPSGLCFCASLPVFTTLLVAFIGAARGIHRLGGFKLIWYRRGVGLTRIPMNICKRVLQVPHQRPSDFKIWKAFKWWNHLSDRELQAFTEMWNAMVGDLRGRDLLNDKEYASLAIESAQAVRQGRVPRILDPLDVFRVRSALPANREARRRIVALARSAQMRPLPRGTVRQMPTFSVLIPHYSETILFSREELCNERGKTELLHFLIKYYRGEFSNFAERICTTHGVPAPTPTAEAPERATGNFHRTPSARRAEEMEEQLRKWASVRMQTLWRTVEGICNAYAGALKLLAAQQEPDLPEGECAALVREKFQVVLAVQQYAKFANPNSPTYNVHEVAAVEAMLQTFGSWIAIAYIDEEVAPEGKRYFSCLVDSSCADMGGARHRSWRVDGTATGGMRRPKFRIELPGYPILGHGKSDNQNCAIIFTRGEVVQMIDANQDAYFEAALFLPLALQEMVGHAAERRGGRRPGILGFREHIFSDVGLLGRLAADSEFAFGTVVQRTMDWPLEARLHYGHPDIMDKLQMVQQGGVSKGTRGLNLSEDIFAGLDLALRGGWVDYKEYFHVGKGRDMGFMSALSFYAKVSMGNGEQAITRQWMRLGLELPLPRLLGIFYTHVGFYLNQALAAWALSAFAFMAAYFTLCRPMDVAFADSAVGFTASYFSIFYFVFVLSSMMPLTLEVVIEDGLRAALLSVATSLLSLSPVFSAFQSKLMGHFFESTVHYGGAQYIPTGRGLATVREPFDKLFRTFAASHMQDGLEVALFLILSYGVYYGWAFYVCLSFVVISWTMSPFLFNPFQFDEPSQACSDFVRWAYWMCRRRGGEAESWVAWADRQQEVRRNASMLWVLVPSPRFFAALMTTCLVLLLAPPLPYEPTWRFVRSILPVTPPLAHMAVCLLLAPLQLCCRGTGKAGTAVSVVPSHVFIAALGLSVTCFEMSAFGWYGSQALCIAFNKYVTLRFLLEAADGIAAHRPGGCALAVLHHACRLWTLSWRFLRDFFLGTLLSGVCFVLSVIPCFARVHALFLFRTRPSRGRKLRAEGSDAKGTSREPSFGEGGPEEVITRLFQRFAPQALGRLGEV